MSFFARVMFLAILAATEIVLAQPSLPALGIQLSTFDRPGWDLRIPLTMTQCEPVFIYYNNSYSVDYGGVTFFADGYDPLLFIGTMPRGVGYIEWICNIAAGYAFWTRSLLFHPIVVQPGSLSSCLRNTTATYQYATYGSSFPSYTMSSPTSLAPLTSPFNDMVATSTVPFPTGSFSTITVNPELIVATPTPAPSLPSSMLASATPPSHSASSTPSTSSHKSKTPVIVGSTIGGIILTVVFGAIFLHLRRRQIPSFDVVNPPIASSPSTAHSKWASSASGPIVAPPSTGVPAINAAIALGHNHDPPMLHSNLGSPASGDVHPPMEQAGGPLLANTAFSTAPKRDPQTIRLQHPQITSQTHESMYPQPNPPPESDSSVHRREGSSLSSGSVPVSQTQPASGPSDGPENATSDMVTALTSFSRLPPEQMRTLFPVLSTIMATQQPSDGARDDSVPGPPPYSD